MFLNKYIELKEISHFAGVRFDLVQAGGGNSSVKLDERRMIVKSSGINLSHITEKTGYVDVDFIEARNWFEKNTLSGLNKKEREQKGNELLLSITKSSLGKPSIETFLHAFLNTYTLHTHPISVNTIAAQLNWEEIFKQEFPDSVCISYETPGIDLALLLHLAINEYENTPKIIFVQNHGLIISCDSSQEVIELTNEVTEKCNKIVGIDLSRYQNISGLQAMMGNFWDDTPMIYCSDDHVISSLISSESKELNIWPFCPDTLIYCGATPVYISSLNDTEPLTKYFQTYSEPAKVIIFNEQVYFVAKSLSKAKESEELMKFHLLAVTKARGKINRLALNEVGYLLNWDAEKYRQGL